MLTDNVIDAATMSAIRGQIQYMRDDTARSILKQLFNAIVEQEGWGNAPAAQEALKAKMQQELNENPRIPKDFVADFADYDLTA